MESYNVGFPNIADSFSLLVPFLKGCGVDGRNQKLKTYQNFLDQLKSGFPDSYDQLELIRMWREIHELCFVFEVFISNKMNPPEKLVHKVMSGSAIPQDDPDKDSNRNFLLELRASIYFLRNGYTLFLDDDCDVVAEKNGKRLYVECKRLYSEKKVSVRYREACKQLGIRMDSQGARRKDRGIVWLDPSPIMLKKCFIYSAYSREGARQAARYDLLSFSSEYFKTDDQPKDKRIIAKVLQMVWPSTTGDDLTTGFTTIMSPASGRIGIIDLLYTRKIFHELSSLEEPK